MILTDKTKEKFLLRIYYREDTNQASDESKIELVKHHAQKWLDRQDLRFVDKLILDWLDDLPPSELGGHNASDYLYEYLNRYNLKDSIKLTIEKCNSLINELNVE